MALEQAAVLAALKKVSPDALPDVSVSDSALVLSYAPGSHGARCSGDDAAVRALKGVKVASAEQSEDRAGVVTVRFSLT